MQGDSRVRSSRASPQPLRGTSAAPARRASRPYLESGCWRRPPAAAAAARGRPATPWRRSRLRVAALERERETAAGSLRGPGLPAPRAPSRPAAEAWKGRVEREEVGGGGRNSEERREGKERKRKGRRKEKERKRTESQLGAAADARRRVFLAAGVAPRQAHSGGAASGALFLQHSPFSNVRSAHAPRSHPATERARSRRGAWTLRGDPGQAAAPGGPGAARSGSGKKHDGRPAPCTAPLRRSAPGRLHWSGGERPSRL